MCAARTGERTITAWNHVRAIMLLPVINVLGIPIILLARTSDFALPSIERDHTARALLVIAGLSAIMVGLGLTARAIAAFVRHGAGTIAPWDATQRLIVDGIYRYCRNPMKTGLFMILIGETLALRSLTLAAWTAFFMIVNVVYVRLSEEPGLRARFGWRYDEYCASVPRWWPSRRGRGCAPTGDARS